MTATVKWPLGIILVISGCLWFFLNLIGVPPGLMSLLPLCGTGCAHIADQYSRAEWQIEFLLSAATTAAGSLVLCRLSWKLSTKDYVSIFGLSGLMTLAVFWLYGLFPFSK
jgi:hypothetical protein